MVNASSASSFHLHLHDMCCIHALQLVAGEGIPCKITDVSLDDASIYKTCASIKTSSCDVDMVCVAYHLEDNDDPSKIILMINAEAVLIIDNTKKNNDDLDNVILMLDSTADNMKKNNNDDSSNIVLMIDTDAASSNNNEEPSDYNTETNDSVDADSNNEMKGIKNFSYNDAVMENSKEETKHSDNATTTLDETILLINTVEKCIANDGDTNDNDYIGTCAPKYVCFNFSTTTDIEQLLSPL